MNEAIVVQNLCKRFRRFHADRPSSLKEAALRGFKGITDKESFWALRDVSFRLERGKMAGVIGQNGAGKSTLLRLLGGVGKPTSGKIQVNGRIGALLDLTAGFHPDLTGRENVFVSGVICGLTRREVAEQMDSIIEFAELENFIDNPIRTYSTGMQMRLGFSVAIHTQPDILLIDEVLAVGDLSFQQKCLERIRKFKESGCTILLISHDLSQIKDFCDEAIWLRSGQLIAHGNPEIVVGEYMTQLSSETRRRTPISRPSIVTASGTELRVNENRFGSMELEIEKVSLLGPDGSPVNELSVGQPLSVSMQFKASKTIHDAIFSVSISRDDGLICFDASTASEGVKVPAIEGAGQITLHLGRVDLAGGKYFVDVGVYESSWAYAYDYHWHAYPLQILAPLSKGVLRPPQLWELGKFAGQGGEPCVPTDSVIISNDRAANTE